MGLLYYLRSTSTPLSCPTSYPYQMLQLSCCFSCLCIRHSLSWFVYSVSTPVTSLNSLHSEASGLLYVSELVEEHSRLAKVVGQRGIYVRSQLLYYLTFLPAGNRADHNCPSHYPILLRFTTVLPHGILDLMPHCLPPELLLIVAPYLPVVHFLPRVLRLRDFRPFPVVLLLFPHNP